MRFLYKFFIVQFFFCVVLCSCAVQNENMEREIVYQLKDGKLLDVYNLDRSLVSTEDISYLGARNKKYGEFGGQLSICSNDNYYCIASGIDMVIPKQLSGQKEWQYLGRICSSDAALNENDVFAIECFHNTNSDKVLYSYSRGIFRYSRSPNWSDFYELVDNKGLFSSLEK